MVSVIGSDISRPGLVPDALRALGDAGVAMIAMQHQIRNVDVQFLVAPHDFDAAVRALHKVLVEDGEALAEDRRAACRCPPMLASIRPLPSLLIPLFVIMAGSGFPSQLTGLRPH